LALPPVWIVTVSVFGGYERRFIGTGSDEFRRVLNAGLSLTGALALISYAVNNELSRIYLLVSMQVIVLLDLLVRLVLRKRLHRRRRNGLCMSTVVAVGHESAVRQLINELRREPHHGLAVVAACLADGSTASEVAGVPVVGDVDSAADAVRNIGAGTVAVLSCPEIDGVKLRTLAWELEKTGTDLCVAPALLDVAGPRTTIRPTAGLTLLHVDHPQLSGPRQVVKDLFDRSLAALALLLLSPVIIGVALAVKLSDQGPAFFTQTRVGKDGQQFKIYKFRTMVVDAEARLAELRAQNEHDGVLFKMRKDPRITALGGSLRKWSLDELPQLFNVLSGDMSLVGPRPALPDEAARYADHVRRRLVVKPGITGLWQVSGRSDLSWDESVRLDLRYVENWSIALDLQIMWKTLAVILGGSGAY
jgi:exopolysaccharide biosynthesis polyprenyl glycosylphosphotransferase